MYAFAKRPRWIALHLVLLAVVALFGLAGVWQLHRLSEKRQRNALIATRQHAPPAPLVQYMADPDRAVYRRVAATGRYDVSREVVLQGRSNRDKPGNHVLTPLVVTGGRAVIVDRGWVPEELDTPPVIGAKPPDGTVSVTGVLLPSEGRAPFTSSSARRPQKVVTRIDVATLERSLPYRAFPLYLVLAKQKPAQSKLPEPISLPAPNEGPHLLYAIQWFLFIVIGVVGYGAILRREARKPSAATTAGR